MSAAPRGAYPPDYHDVMERLRTTLTPDHVDAHYQLHEMFWSKIKPRTRDAGHGRTNSMNTRPSDAVYIYALQDPITSAICYVGASRKPTRRLAEHIMSGSRERSKKQPWLDDLRACGLAPHLLVLEACLGDARYVQEREGWWINYYRSCGEPLLNTFAPGYGRLAPSPLRGVTRDPVMVERSAAAHRGVAHTKGWMHSDKAKAAISQRRRLPEEVVRSIRRLLATGMSGNAIARQLDVSNSTVSSVKRNVGIYQDYGLVKGGVD